MRVIAGKYKRRVLKTISSNSTRPTTDKNKENLFNIIQPYLQGGNVLDLFGGSGGLGIEAISRGMDVLYAVDKNYQAYSMIKENIASIKMEEESHIYKADYKKALSIFENDGVKFDLVLLDPPYGKKIIQPLLINMQEKELLNDGCIIVCEDLKEEIFEEQYDNLIKFKTVTYGITALHIYSYEKKDDENEK